MMSLLAFATPSGAVLLPFPAESSFVINELTLTHQADLAAPDQPPRLLIF
jgi:hypothetical protein